MAGNNGAATNGSANSRNVAIMKLALFVFFVFTRALHPMLIDFSKVEGKILYAKNTPIVMNKICTVVLMNLVGLLTGGTKGVGLCWQPQCLMVFGIIGAIYALGDFLEMLSMGSLNGGVYQVLLQMKLMITALMVWWLKGTGQSSLQWHVLFAIFLATSTFVLVDMGASGGDGGVPLGAVFCVLLKVAVSCYCAVLSEKYLKAFASLPIYAKISGLSTTWTIASCLMCMGEAGVRENGFFAHWDSMTCFVTVSFIVKTVSTMYLLQALDSVQKNIGEALAVIVIYFSDVAGGKPFELAVALLAMLVVGLVKTYLIAPKVQKAKPALMSKKVQVVALNKEAPAAQKGGVSTMSCEVAEALPDGVFYGLLGGVHPVCGTASSEAPTRCELMLLSQPVAPSDKGGDAEAGAPYMPNKSLTVLGQVRAGASDGKKADVQQCVSDAEKARALLLERFGA